MNTFTKPRITGKYAAAYLENQRKDGSMESWNQWNEYKLGKKYMPVFLACYSSKWEMRWVEYGHIPFTQEGHEEEWATFLKWYFFELFDHQYNYDVKPLKSIESRLFQKWVEEYNLDCDIKFVGDLKDKEPRNEKECKNGIIECWDSHVRLEFVQLKIKGCTKYFVHTGQILKPKLLYIKGKTKVVYARELDTSFNYFLQNFKQHVLMKRHDITNPPLYARLQHVFNRWVMKEKKGKFIIFVGEKIPQEFFDLELEGVQKVFDWCDTRNQFDYAEFEETKIFKKLDECVDYIKKSNEVVKFDPSYELDLKGKWIICYGEKLNNDFKELKIDGVKKAFRYTMVNEPCYSYRHDDIFRTSFKSVEEVKTYFGKVRPELPVKWKGDMSRVKNLLTRVRDRSDKSRYINWYTNRLFPSGRDNLVYNDKYMICGPKIREDEFLNLVAWLGLHSEVMVEPQLPQLPVEWKGDVSKAKLLLTRVRERPHKSRYIHWVSLLPWYSDDNDFIYNDKYMICGSKDDKTAFFNLVAWLDEHPDLMKTVTPQLPECWDVENVKVILARVRKRSNKSHYINWVSLLPWKSGDDELIYNDKYMICALEESDKFDFLNLIAWLDEHPELMKDEENGITIFDNETWIHDIKGNWLVYYGPELEENDEFNELKIDGVKKAYRYMQHEYGACIDYIIDGVAINLFYSIEQVKEYFQGKKVEDDSEVEENGITIFDNAEWIHGKGKWVVYYGPKLEENDEFKNLEIDGVKKGYRHIDDEGIEYGYLIDGAIKTMFHSVKDIQKYFAIKSIEEEDDTPPEESNECLVKECTTHRMSVDTQLCAKHMKCSRCDCLIGCKIVKDMVVLCGGCQHHFDDYHKMFKIYLKGFGSKKDMWDWSIEMGTISSDNKELMEKVSTTKFDSKSLSRLTLIHLITDEFIELDDGRKIYKVSDQLNEFRMEPGKVTTSILRWGLRMQ